jgi:hypothetical protein
MTKTAPQMIEANHELHAALEAIASRHCDVETLQARGRDCLDFPEVSVVGLHKALLAAYALGLQAAAK